MKRCVVVSVLKDVVSSIRCCISFIIHSTSLCEVAIVKVLGQDNCRAKQGDYRFNPVDLIVQNVVSFHKCLRCVGPHTHCWQGPVKAQLTSPCLPAESSRLTGLQNG